MRRCQAITTKRSHYKNEYNGRCQSSASIIVHGVGLCGVHLNTGFEKPLQVVTELPILKDEDL